MDKIKGMAEKAMNKDSSSSSSNTTTTGGASGKEDYGDKGLDFVEKKTGHAQSRETNEKITDQGRTFFEGKTGKDIPDKYSN